MEVSFTGFIKFVQDMTTSIILPMPKEILNQYTKLLRCPGYLQRPHSPEEITQIFGRFIGILDYSVLIKLERYRKN